MNLLVCWLRVLLSVCVSVCVVLSLSSPICLLVMVGGLYLLFYFLVSPFSAAPRARQATTRRSEAPRDWGPCFRQCRNPCCFVGFFVVCVCARARAKGGSNACSLWCPRHDKRLLGSIYRHVENPCFLFLFCCCCLGGGGGGGGVVMPVQCGAPGPTIDYRRSQAPETGGPVYGQCLGAASGAWPGLCGGAPQGCVFDWGPRIAGSNRRHADSRQADEQNISARTSRGARSEVCDNEQLILWGRGRCTGTWSMFVESHGQKRPSRHSSLTSDAKSVGHWILTPCQPTLGHIRPIAKAKIHELRIKAMENTVTTVLCVERFQAPVLTCITFPQLLVLSHDREFVFRANGYNYVVLGAGTSRVIRPFPPLGLWRNESWPRLESTKMFLSQRRLVSPLLSCHRPRLKS